MVVSIRVREEKGYAACRSHNPADHNQLCDTNEPGKKRLEASFGFDTHHMNLRNDEAEKHPRIDVRRTRKETCVP